MTVSLAVWHMNSNDMLVGIPMSSVIFHTKIEIKKSTLNI